MEEYVALYPSDSKKNNIRNVILDMEEHVALYPHLDIIKIGKNIFVPLAVIGHDSISNGSTVAKKNKVINSEILACLFD